jgi:hypothetical protein
MAFRSASQAMPQCRPLARDHAAPEPTLLLTKVYGPCLVGVRPLAWCSRPRDSAALLGGALDVDWRTEVRRYALPIAFLLLVTAAILVVRGAL